MDKEIRAMNEIAIAIEQIRDAVEDLDGDEFDRVSDYVVSRFRLNKIAVVDLLQPNED